jgi:hypothetical protein
MKKCDEGCAGPICDFCYFLDCAPREDYGYCRELNIDTYRCGGLSCNSFDCFRNHLEVKDESTIDVESLFPKDESGKRRLGSLSEAKRKEIINKLPETI